MGFHAVLLLAAGSFVHPKRNTLVQSTNKNETLEKVFKAYPESDMMRWTLDRSEDVYHSNHREPLGKGWVRGHNIPQHLGTEVPFGQSVNAKANTAVSLARRAIAPVDLEPEVRVLPTCIRQSMRAVMQRNLHSAHGTEVHILCMSSSSFASATSTKVCKRLGNA